MRILEEYSHLNADKLLLESKPLLYKEIKDIILSIDAAQYRTKISQEKTMSGKRLYEPEGIKNEFATLFKRRGWKSIKLDYCVTTNKQHLAQIKDMSFKMQEAFLKDHSVSKPLKSSKTIDFVQDRVAVQVQFGKYPFVAYDLFVKHQLFYSSNIIDVGIEVLPMKSMIANPRGGRLMSTGIAYFEGEVYNIMIQGERNPPVPLVLIGIAP